MIPVRLIMRDPERPADLVPLEPLRFSRVPSVSEYVATSGGVLRVGSVVHMPAGDVAAEMWVEPMDAGATRPSAITDGSAGKSIRPAKVTPRGRGNSAP